jgi:hypothetical protein
LQEEIDMPLRNPSVVVAVVHDAQKRFFVCFNESWHQYAFPMKQRAPGQDWAAVAKRAFEKHAQRALPANAEIEPLEFVGAYPGSGRPGKQTYYDYHVFEVKPRLALPAGSFAGRCGFLAYDELREAELVSWSTRDIASALVEFQETAVAVICREVKPKAGRTEREYLMVRKAAYHGYFFPVVRLKTQAKPEQAVISAVRSDAGYQGEIEATRHGEVEHEHFSPRYNRPRHFRFHICRVHLPGLELNVSPNPLETALQALARAEGDAQYWGWFPEEHLKNPKIMSPTVEATRLAVIQASEAR